MTVCPSEAINGQLGPGACGDLGSGKFKCGWWKWSGEIVDSNAGRNGGRIGGQAGAGPYIDAKQRVSGGGLKGGNDELEALNTFAGESGLHGCLEGREVVGAKTQLEAKESALSQSPRARCFGGSPTKSSPAEVPVDPVGHPSCAMES